MERVDKHVRAAKRNPGCDETIAESSDNVSFGSASEAGSVYEVGNSLRSFSSIARLYRSPCPGSRHISNSWLCVTWLKLGKSPTESLRLIPVDAKGRNSRRDLLFANHLRRSFPGLFLALSGGCFGSSRGIAVDQARVSFVSYHG